MTTPTKLGIINRALQRIGALSIASLSEQSVNASEAMAMYDSLRLAEQRRNVWGRFIRENALRAISPYDTQLLTFANWAIGTTYAMGDIATGSDGVLYQSRQATNLAHDPVSTSGYWTQYIGPDIALEYCTAWSSTVTYDKGNHAVGADAAVYVSLSDTNLNHNPVGDGNVHWTLATTVDENDPSAQTATNFYAGEIVYIGRNVYLSLQSGNGDQPPTFRWLTFTTAPTLTDLNIIYPLGSGPREQLSTRNIYRLPYGFLREAPSDPLVPAPPRTIRFESNYIVGDNGGTSSMVLRYVADVSDASQFDPLFVEGFSCRLAFELCERLTQSVSKLGAIGKEYQQFMSEARTVNAIESGPVSPEVDSWLAVKVSGAYSPFQYT